MTRGQAIAAKCRECIHDPSAAGTWREQIAICQCADCPLWRFRPLPRNVPPWIAPRDAGSLPAGFGSLAHDIAIRHLRGNFNGSTANAVVFATSRTQRNAGATPVAGARGQNARAGARRITERKP